MGEKVERSNLAAERTCIKSNILVHGARSTVEDIRNWHLS